MQLYKKPLGSGPKGNAGFTLIELAIVLVVIGLILAAVLKGEDLIQDATMLDFATNPVREAQTAAMSYYNRTGQFPDAVFDGNSMTGPLYNMYQVGIKSVLNLKNPFTSGSNFLGMTLGTIQITDSTGNTANYPVMVIQAITPPAGGRGPTATSWTQSELGYANYLKKTIDGNLNWQTGSVRAVNSGISITYAPLASEIMGGSTTSTYDGYFTTNTTPYTTANFVTPAAGQSFTLVYFYYQQPN
jgi:prepilin-type N-terminal cleavage/methylation domain-containing protein